MGGGRPRTVAWVGLDEFDNRPGTFWADVVAALRRSGVALPTALPVARGRDADHVFLLWLAAALAAQDPPVTLVLDDLHLLTNPTVLEGLDYLLRNVGPGLRLVVSARMDPLPLHRYRLAGELTEIRARDLAFTVAEAGLLLARHGITLTADSLVRLTRRTEGWAARPAHGRDLHGHSSRPRPVRQRADHRGQHPDRLSGGGGPAARTAAQQPSVPHPNPAALVALAWVHLGHYELREARSRLEQVDAALGVTPDKLIGAVAWLAAAYCSLAQGRAAAAAQSVARARSGWSVPAWLDQRLSLAESRAYAAAGDIRAALAAAGRVGRGTSPEATVALAHAWAASGDAENARRVLAPALTADGGTPDRVRLQAWLMDARLSYTSGDHARGRRSLASALRLAAPEQIRLPFALERGWIEPMLRQ